MSPNSRIQNVGSDLPSRIPTKMGTKILAPRKHAFSRRVAADERRLAKPQAALFPRRVRECNLLTCAAASTGSVTATELPLGVYIRDTQQSDMVSYERALGLLGLGGLQRMTAMKLIEGLELRKEGDRIVLHFLTVVPFFKVTESYTLNGESSFGRRDLRPGRQAARAFLAADGTLCLQSKWQEPNTGSLQERFIVKGDGVLEVVASLKVRSGEEVTRMVYQRVEKWHPQNRWNPVAALSMMANEK